MRVGVIPSVSQDTLLLASPLPIKTVTACCFGFVAGAGRAFAGVQIAGAMEGEIRERPLAFKQGGRVRLLCKPSLWFMVDHILAAAA